MGRLLGLVCCLSLAADVSPLRKLHETGRIFELRRALQASDRNDADTLFYRAVIDSRFGNEAVAVEGLQKFLATHPNRELERKAYEELASAWERTGSYGKAAHAWSEALGLTPADDAQRADTENTQALYQALRDVPPQTVHSGDGTPVQARHNGLGSWDVPIEVNGHHGQWIFDTGANLSTITQSEASRMGLSLVKTDTYVRGSTGDKNQLRVAVANDLRFGPANVRNVVFLVLADEALYISPLKYQIHGILGLPVLRALGRVGISSKGLVQIEETAPASSEEPNLFFDELSPLVETRHGDHRVQLFVDTGANDTVVYPSFRNALRSDEMAKLRRKKEKTAGAGGVISRETDVLPALQLELLRRPIDLTKVSLLSTQPMGNAGYRDGVLGMDALAGGFVLDFRAMQLSVE